MYHLCMPPPKNLAFFRYGNGIVFQWYFFGLSLPNVSGSSFFTFYYSHAQVNSVFISDFLAQAIGITVLLLMSIYLARKS